MPSSRPEQGLKDFESLSPAQLGDIVSAGILSKLEHTRKSEGTEIENLSRSYYERRHERWSLLERRLAELGVEIDENP